MLRRLLHALHGAGAPLDDGDAHRWRVGGLYAIPREAGGYRIAKMLACDANVVHLKLYGRHFRTVPQWLEPADLGDGIDLDAVLAGEDMTLAIAHLPMDARGFTQAKPRWIQDAPVTVDERAAMHDALDAQTDAAALAQADERISPHGNGPSDDGRS